jgi:ferritin-like metal-binding protein YciE
MAPTTDRDTKLVQYLGEAFGKEKELETALEAHIGMTERAAYKKRLRSHLTETKQHARRVERRIKQLGGNAPATQAIVGRATATLKGPVHALRGSGAEERELKNAKTEYSEEAEEIATYTSIEALAESVGDRETAKLAREIRREEERMGSYLERLIPTLAKAVARAEIPASERSTRSRRSSSRRRSTSRRTSGTSRARSSRSARSSGRRRTSGTRRRSASRS